MQRSTHGKYTGYCYSVLLPNVSNVRDARVVRPYTDAVIAVPCWLVSSSQPILPAHDGWCHNWDCFGVQHNIRSSGAQLWGVYSWRQPVRGWHDINSWSQGFDDSKLRLFFSLLLTGAGCWLVLVSAQLQFYLRRRRNLSGVIFVFSQTWGSSIKWCAGGFSYLLVQDIYCNQI